jgi:membrane protein DedA with SNARE-associated domain
LENLDSLCLYVFVVKIVSSQGGIALEEITGFLIRHGYLMLFALVFAEQVGLPLPAVPILLAAGALAGAGQLNFGLTILLALIASLLSDLLWYQIGRSRGSKVLNFLCRVSLEPDSCVRLAENTFTRYGPRSLLVAKFLPGFNTLAPPMAGITGMSLPGFLLCDGLGALIWAGSFEVLGYLFSDQLEQVAGYALQLGSLLLVLLAGGLIAYIVWKYIRRRRFIRELRIARITPEELKRILDAGEQIFIVDLRHPIDHETVPFVIPGALRLVAEELEERNTEIPRDRDVVLYCT